MKYITKPLVLIGCIVASLSSLAQNTSTPLAAAKNNKLSIGLSFSPDLCYRTLKNSDGSESSALMIQMRNEQESPKLGYTTGVAIAYTINKHIGLESGIQFSSKGYKAIWSVAALRLPNQIDSGKGFTLPTSESGKPVDKWVSKSNFYYLDIPLLINYRVGQRRLTYIASLGMVTNIFIKANQTDITVYEDGSKKRGTSNAPSYLHFNPINLSTMLSLGVDYKLNTRLHARVEPTLRMGLLSISNTPITGYLWNAGLNMSLYYTL